MRGAFFYEHKLRKREMTMMDENTLQRKNLSWNRLGTVTQQMIDQRAHEIARDDGRNLPNDLDRSIAREELTGARSGSEKVPTRGEPGRDREMPLVSTGEKASTVRPEDDENIPEELIQEGTEEADHDRRVRSGRTSGK